MKAGQHTALTSLVTTDEVLSEFLAFFAARGMYWRREAVKVVRKICNHSQIEVIPQSRASFLSGLALYENRLDKDFSLADCISMAVMRERGISEVLTHDHHFEQEGFTLLLTVEEE